MASYYTYFVSSLPMLGFGAKPPFSFEKFLQKCQDIISDSDITILKSILIASPVRKIFSNGTNDSIYEGNQPTLRKWYDFDKALRNELVKIRAGRKHLEPQKYLRGDMYADSYIARIATAAHRNPLILEAEKMLDQERWRALDELAVGHYFDIDFLIIYSIKLLILQRWEIINSADNFVVLEQALQTN